MTLKSSKDDDFRNIAADLFCILLIRENINF